MEPRVSVVITTYNQAPYIVATLKSVFAQVYQPVEIIVVDDGSTDDTPTRLEPFSDRIVCLRQENQGVAGSRNTGIRSATGNLIAFLDGDDLWEPDKLSVQVTAAQAHPQSGLIAVDGVEFSDTEILRPTLLGSCCTDLPQGATHTGRYYRHLLHGNFISTTSQVMVPAEVLRTVGLSKGQFGGASDYDLYLRVAAKYDVTIVRQSLVRWRYLPTSFSGIRHVRSLRYAPEGIAVLKNQLRQASEEDRQLILTLCKRKIIGASEGLYYYGREFDRSWAAKTLLRLYIRNPRYVATAAFLIALWCPEVITTRLGPRVRKFVGAPHNRS